MGVLIRIPCLSECEETLVSPGDPRIVRDTVGSVPKYLWVPSPRAFLQGQSSLCSHHLTNLLLYSHHHGGESSEGVWGGFSELGYRGPPVCILAYLNKT